MVPARLGAVRLGAQGLIVMVTQALPWGRVTSVKVRHVRLWPVTTAAIRISWGEEHFFKYMLIYIISWASYQICKIAGYACAENAGNVFPRRRLQRKLLISDPGLHHGTCVTHVPITARARRTCRDACRDREPAVAGKTFPAHAQPAVLRSGKRPIDLMLKFVHRKNLFSSAGGVSVKWSLYSFCLLVMIMRYILRVQNSSIIKCLILFYLISFWDQKSCLWGFILVSCNFWFLNWLKSLVFMHFTWDT